ncbi:MAG: DUF697 domain-containing protein [Bacteroidota bacterium]
MKGKIYKTAKEQIKKQFMGSSKSDRSKHADTVIRNHVVFSMGASFIPVFALDFLAVGATQLDMIRQLCKVYEIDFQETQGKAIVSALTGPMLARAGAKGLIKMVPILGQVASIPLSVSAGASTYALGEVFKRHFENGGTILDFDVERLKKVYQEKFEKGKEVAKDLKKEQKEGGFKAKATEQSEAAQEETATTSSNITERLKELANLKESGILTEEEFQKMKQKLIDSL